jgi:hypothetical protein
LNNLDLFESLYEAENKKLDHFIATIREPVKGGRDPFAVVESLLEKKRTRAAYQPGYHTSISGSSSAAPQNHQ